MKSEGKKNRKGRRAIPRTALSVLFAGALVLTATANAPRVHACHNPYCEAFMQMGLPGITGGTMNTVNNVHAILRRTVLREMRQYASWLVRDMFIDYIKPRMQTISGQLNALGLYEVMVFGTMLDAKEQIGVQRTLDGMEADAAAAFHPDVQMCALGTVARDLAAGGMRSMNNAAVLMQRSQDRQIGRAGTISGVGVGADRTEGISGDVAARLLAFRVRYCDPAANAGTFAGTVCGPNTPGPRVNRDIDYARVVGSPMTIDADYTDPAGVQTTDEADVLALASNLFAHKAFSWASGAVMDLSGREKQILQARAVFARRSVAENSFYAIAGMKMAGGDATGDYAAAVLQRLGISAADARAMIGTNPSYYALLDVMAQKVYQTPEFYTDLYDTPENAARKDVAMQAVGLMLDRNMYKSDLRYESILAVLLETQIRKYQGSVVTSMGLMEQGEKGIDE